MELGAVVVVPTGTEGTQTASGDSLSQHGAAPIDSVCSPRAPILGNDTLQFWIDRVRKLGVGNLWLASSHDPKLLCSRFTDLSRQGVEKVLVIKLKSYAEMDLADLLRFHCEKRNPITEAEDAAGSLGVRLLNCNALDRSADDGRPSCKNSASFTAHYQFRGYTKRLHSSQERRDLIRDALTGGCAIRPSGQQVQDQVWIGKNAVVDRTARILGPAYIGPRTVIHSATTIGPFSAVEEDCIVDSGTCVEQSCVLPRTYLAAGLYVRQSVVNGDRLEQLGWPEVVDLAPSGMASRIPEPALRKWRASWMRRARLRISPGFFSRSPMPFSFSTITTSPSWVRIDL